MISVAELRKTYSFHGDTGKALKDLEMLSSRSREGVGDVLGTMENYRLSGWMCGQIVRDEGQLYESKFRQEFADVTRPVHGVLQRMYHLDNSTYAFTQLKHDLTVGISNETTNYSEEGRRMAWQALSSLVNWSFIKEFQIIHDEMDFRAAGILERDFGKVIGNIRSICSLALLWGVNADREEFPRLDNIYLNLLKLTQLGALGVENNEIVDRLRDAKTQSHNEVVAEFPVRLKKRHRSKFRTPFPEDIYHLRVGLDGIPTHSHYLNYHSRKNCYLGGLGNAGGL